MPRDTENVRLSGKTGSDWRTAKTALLTQLGHLIDRPRLIGAVPHAGPVDTLLEMLVGFDIGATTSPGNGELRERGTSSKRPP